MLMRFFSRSIRGQVIQNQLTSTIESQTTDLSDEGVRTTF